MLVHLSYKSMTKYKAKYNTDISDITLLTFLMF